MNRPIEFKTVVTLPRIAYLHIDFANSSCAQAISAIEYDASFALDVYESWPALITSIVTNPPQAVLIHLNSFTGAAPIAEVTIMINALLAVSSLETRRHIGVVVDNLVDVEFVKELRKSNILNIVPGVEFRGQAESTKATMALLAGEPYVLNVVQEEATLPRVVSFWSKPIPQLSASVKQQITTKKLYAINFCDTWDSLAEAVLEPTDLVLFHCKMRATQGGLLLSEIVDMIDGLVRYTSGTPLKIAAVIDKDTPREIIKELRKTSVCGIVPSSEYWGADIGVVAVVDILNKGSYWPKDIIASMPGNIQKPIVTKSSFQLTARQQEIVNLISTRGLSNKRIAGILHIAESTVKIHVSAALKIYGVRTRTQLAVVANK